MVYIDNDLWPQRWCEECQKMTSARIDLAEGYWLIITRPEGMRLAHLICGHVEEIPEGFRLDSEGRNEAMDLE